MALLAPFASPCAAQVPLAVEVRGGAVYSTPFARATVLVPAELQAVALDVEVGPRPAPVAEVAFAARPVPSLVLELRSGASVAGVAGKGGAESWSAGRVATVHVLGGVRFPLPRVPGADFRTGVGKLFYLSGDVNLLEEREHTGVLLSAGLGYGLPVPLAPVAVAEVQWHEFDPAPLAETGVGAGTVTRVLVHLAVAVGSMTP